MNLVELKEQILNGAVDDSFKIFIYDDNTFLVNQYIEAISASTHLIVNKINSIYETQQSALSLVLDFNNYLNVLETELFEERAEDYSIFTNSIVICKKIDKKLEPSLAEHIIKFPKLEDWQIKAYMATLCTGLSTEEIDWLYQASAGDIYKIINELDKIRLFDKELQHDILNELRFDPSTDLFQQTIFDIADAIIKNDKRAVSLFLQHEKNFNFDPIAISNLILATCKKVALIKLNSGATATDIGVSPKQYTAFKNYLYNNYAADKVFKDLSFLSALDLRLKSSEFTFSKDRMLDYIICNLMF